MTRKWPAEINGGLTSGRVALPANGNASIFFSFTRRGSSNETYTSTFDRRAQAWTGRSGRPANPGLVLYAMSDGGFAVWDPARNCWRKKGNVDVQDRPPACVFGPAEVWSGLAGTSGGSLCEGLIRDWAGWQKENGAAFGLLCNVLEALSPSPAERPIPGDLTRINLDNTRDMPTIRMPYGQDVPLVHASAGMRRILALAYLLVWAWEEHRKAAKVLSEPATEQIVFLIDEIESHLHPRWQFQIVPSLLNVMRSVASSPRRLVSDFGAPLPTVQLVTATHSPMVLASVEPVFEPEKDAWFDLGYCGANGSDVVLTKRESERHGDVTDWLTSEAFDLNSGRTPPYAKLLDDAAELLEESAVRPEEVRAMEEKLARALSPTDPFLFRWRSVCTRKGLLA